MKAIILKGIPASGKTTKAQEFVNQGYLRINMDIIREENQGMPEKDVQEYQYKLINSACSIGKNIVVDNTHCNPKSLAKVTSFCESLGYEVEVIDMIRDILCNKENNPFSMKYSTEEALKTCIHRNDNREKKVPASVIYGMFLLDGHTLGDGEKIVICDLDGTLYNIEHRLKYLKGETKNRKKFECEDEIAKDIVCEPVKSVINALANDGYKIFLVSGRRDSMCNVTTKNLERDEILYDMLLMRKSWDGRKDNEIKKDILDLITANHTIAFSLDDRASVKQMRKDNGIYVFDCAQGKDDF